MSESIIARLQGVYEALTPGAIERADIDGMAFTVKDAIMELERLKKATSQSLLAVVDCPICSGDCAGANPPMINCPLEAASGRCDLLAEPKSTGEA